MSDRELSCVTRPFVHCFFFFTDTAPTEIYTLSLHDALPISAQKRSGVLAERSCGRPTDNAGGRRTANVVDRKSTRLNSSHRCISYAVFCLKKKNKQTLNLYIDHIPQKTEFIRH